MGCIRPTTVLALSLAALGSAVLIAKPAHEKDGEAIFKTQISLGQAIATAEAQHAGGRAIRAELESSKKNGWIYEIEVAAGGKKFDVKVDPQKGTLISSVEDKPDPKEEEDDEDPVD